MKVALRKKDIYGREKHGVRRNTKSRTIGKERGGKMQSKEKVLPICLTSILQPVWLGRPHQEYKNSIQHSYPGHRGTQ